MVRGVEQTATTQASAADRADGERVVISTFVAEAGDRTARLFESVGAQCVRTVRARSDTALSAARWRYPSFELITESLPGVLLCYTVAGTPSVVRRANGRAMRKVLRPGRVTVVPNDARVEWRVEGPSEAWVLCIDPQLLRVFAEDFGAPGRWRLRDVFGVEDAWLASYFRMLALEGDEAGGDVPASDALFMAETQHALLRHVMRHHSRLDACQDRATSARNRVNPLAPRLQRRVADYIEAHLAEALHLRTLAAQVHMSVEHFVRSFKAATGITPYQFVLARRLDRAAELLRTDGDSIPLVATRCGFRTPNHFSASFRARFGVKPSMLRREA
jgi:AraC family transcriptional regulator